MALNNPSDLCIEPGSTTMKAGTQTTSPVNPLWYMSRDSKLKGTCFFSSSILIFFQYACRPVRPDCRRLPIGIYIYKRVYSAIIVVMF